MITVRIKVSMGRIALDCRGHAGYDEIGKDIVCSAASILCMTLCENIRDYVVDSQGDGVLSVHKDKPTEYERQAAVVVAKGFKLLEEYYPSFVKCFFT